MRPTWAVFVLCVGLGWSGSVAAVGGTATDQGVSLAYVGAHWGAAPGADLIGVDASGDPLVESGWWYRAEGDAREFPLPAPDSETYVDSWITATWNNLGGKNFFVQEITYVLDSEGPSGGFLTYMLVRNDNPTAKQFTLFHYVDVSLAGSSGGDSGTLVNAHFLKFSDGSSRAAYKASQPSHFKVASGPTIKDLLNDGGLTNLDDAGLPFGPGDLTAAYQFGPTSLATGLPNGLALLSLGVNPAADHVKGDYWGTFLHAPLVGQSADLGNRTVQWMRRTSQLNLATVFAAPTATASLAGIDDFDGDFKDEVVFRDTVSGVAYVGYGPIVGAPTLALNWKLAATGDFDADGKADILWRNTTSQKLVIWTMNGSAKVGNILPSPDQAVAANWEVAGAADFDGDGARDLLWYNQTSGKIVLWYMNSAVVRTAGLFTTPSGVGNNNWRVVAVGDYGKGPAQTGTPVYDAQDIVWQNDSSKRLVVWHMDQAAARTGGVFTTPDTVGGGYDVVGPR